MECESCFSDRGSGGRCEACGRDLSKTGYQYPDPGWCMSEDEYIAACRERGYRVEIRVIKPKTNRDFYE